MDANSTEQSSGLYDLLAWAEKNNNWKKVVGVAALVVIGVAGFAFYQWNQRQAEIDANTELLSIAGRASQEKSAPVSADEFAKVAQAHPNTSAADRAHLLAAAAAFDKGDFAKATTHFDTVVKEAKDNTFKAQGAYGLAAVLEAQKNYDQAIQKYEAVSKQYSTENVATQAKLAVGRIYEAQNKPEQALKIYSEIEKSQTEFEYWKGDAAERRDRLESRFPNLKKSDAGEQVFEVTTPPAPVVPAATNK